MCGVVCVACEVCSTCVWCVWCGVCGMCGVVWCGVVCAGRRGRRCQAKLSTKRKAQLHHIIRDKADQKAKVARVCAVRVRCACASTASVAPQADGTNGT
jgi:hypothetical protein